MVLVAGDSEGADTARTSFETYGYQKRVTTTLIYSLLSSTLSVVNKFTLDEFPFPAFVLAVQLTSSASVIYLGSEVGFVNLSSVSWEIVFGFVPLTISFFFLLASSLLLMANSPFNVFLICKSLTPFFMSLSETLYFRTPCPSLQSFISMAGMAIGSVLYTRYDAHLSATYLVYALLFICCSVFEGLIAKQTIEKFALNQTTRTLLMNALACPIAIIWTICTETTVVTQLKLSSALSLGISCALGLGMGIATMQMRTIFSATYVAIVGVCNKFLSLVFASLLLSGSPSFQSTLSTAFVLLCSSFYNGNSAVSAVQGETLMRKTVLSALILFMITTGTLNERPFVTKPPATNNHGSSATSGKLFSGSKTRLYEHPRGAGDSRTFVKSSWRKSGIGQCDHFAVVTTIFAPSEAVIDACRRLREYEGCLLIIGDAKGPVNYTLSPALVSCSYNFVSYVEQQNFGGSFAHNLPQNHFGRKNLGYVLAIQNGATSVWDFDDDNIFINDKMGMILKSKKDSADVQVLRISQPLGDVLNPYPALGSAHFSWPRGFPLTEIKSKDKSPKWLNTRHAHETLKHIGVVQALANHDPDVDAIYRLQRKLPLSFVPTSEAMIFPVPLGTMSPFNAQATLWTSPDAFWGLYLPVSVHGRVSDIWRSYIFQRLAKYLCLQIAFSVSPWVEQRRNAHSYIADLDAEHDLYFKTERLLEFLDTWTSSGESIKLPDLFLDLYVALYEREYVHAADVKLSRMWIEELREAGYSFPPIRQSCTRGIVSSKLTSNQTKNFYVGINRYGGYNNQLLTYLHHMLTASKLNRTMVVPHIFANGPDNHEDAGFDTIWEQPQLKRDLQVEPSHNRLSNVCPHLAVCSGENLTKVQMNYIKKFYDVVPVHVDRNCSSESCILNTEENESYAFKGIPSFPRRIFLCPGANELPSFRLVPRLDSLRIQILSILSEFFVIGAHVRRGYWSFGWQQWDKTPNGCWPSFLDMVRTIASECKYLRSVKNHNATCIVFTASDAPFEVFPSISTVQLKSLLSDLARLGVLTEHNFEQVNHVAERITNLTGLEHSALEQSLLAHFPVFIGNPCSSWSGMVAVQRVSSKLSINTWRDFTVRQSSWTNMSSCVENVDYWRESQMRADFIRASLEESPEAPVDGIDTLSLTDGKFDWDIYQEERRSAQYRYRAKENDMSR